MNKIKEIIGDEDKWLTLLLKGEYIGTIQLSKADKEDAVLDKFEIQRNGDDTFSLWYNHDYGYCYFAFDDCKIETL